MAVIDAIFGQQQDQLRAVKCATCLVLFGIGTDYEARRLKDRKAFFCPNGHENYFSGETPEQKQIRTLKEQLAAKESALGWEKAQREETKKSLIAQKAQTTKARNELHAVKQRVGGGTCPCCKRHFQTLRRHMATKHPEYREAPHA